MFVMFNKENACGETLKLLGSFSQLIGRGGHGARPFAASLPIRSGNEDWKYSAEEVQSASSSLYSSPHTPLTDQNFKTENKCTDCLTSPVCLKDSEEPELLERSWVWGKHLIPLVCSYSCCPFKFCACSKTFPPFRYNTVIIKSTTCALDKWTITVPDHKWDLFPGKQRDRTGSHVQSVFRQVGLKTQYSF